jgi:hypothetical protein
MAMLVEFNTNIIVIGPPGLILWEKYNLMAAILENGRLWPPYWNFPIFWECSQVFVGVCIYGREDIQSRVLFKRL